MSFITCAVLATVGGLVVMSAGCGNSNPAPLGGPHGGTASAAVPGPGNFQTSGIEGGFTPPPADGAAEDGAEGDEGGVLVDGGGDAALPTDAGDASASSGAPTWTTIFNAYLPMCKTCHVEMGTPDTAYAWLVSQGFIAGAFSPLVSSAQSCLSWYGGDMPPGGTSNPAAVSAMDAWAAAGALGPSTSDN